MGPAPRRAETVGSFPQSQCPFLSVVTAYCKHRFHFSLCCVIPDFKCRGAYSVSVDQRPQAH